MKGISHFSIGVAAASCFPAAVEAGAAGNPLYFVLGGAFGLLPDTLDFKFTRFFYRHDVEVSPDPNRRDPQAIADAVARAVNRAFETGRPFRIKLDTVRLGADRWQRYDVTFDVPGRRVVVRYGPEVDTGSMPIPGTEPETPLEAAAPLACDVKLDYLAVTNVDIFDGPVFQMKPLEDGTVVPQFIPWHRAWSHSFTIGLLCAGICGVIFGPLAAFVAAVALSAHVLADQLGHMGSNLFYPLSKERTHGFRLMHSGQSWPNFAAVWTSCLVIFWNLYSQTRGVPLLSPIKLAVIALALPALALVLLQKWWFRNQCRGDLNP